MQSLCQKNQRKINIKDRVIEENRVKSNKNFNFGEIELKMWQELPL
jgi:hypothetical protein